MQVPSCGLGLTRFDHQFAARSRKSLNCSVKSSRPMATGSCWNQEISPSGGNVLWLEGADKKRLLIAWQPESNGPIYPWVSLNGRVAKDLELGKRSRFMYILYWSDLICTVCICTGTGFTAARAYERHPKYIKICTASAVSALTTCPFHHIVWLWFSITSVDSGHASLSTNVCAGPPLRIVAMVKHDCSSRQRSLWKIEPKVPGRVWYRRIKSDYMIAWRARKNLVLQQLHCIPVHSTCL